MNRVLWLLSFGIIKYNLFKYHGWFNLLFSPFGCKVFRHLIHLSSCDSKIDVIFSGSCARLGLIGVLGSFYFFYDGKFCVYQKITVGLAEVLFHRKQFIKIC